MITFLVHVTEPGMGSKKAKTGTEKADFPYKSSAEGLIDFLPLPSLLVDSNQKLVGVNAEGRSLFKALEFGQDLAFSIRNPDVLDALEQLKNGENQIETDLVFSSPYERNFRLTARTLLPEKTGKGLYLLVFTDVTHQHDADKIRSAFIANVSHELRSPLSTLIGAVETLKSAAKDDPKAIERFLGMMEEEAWRMKRIVDDLLSLSKLEAHEHVPPEGTVDLAKLLAKVIGTMEKRLKTRKMTLTCKCQNGLPEIPGDWDEIQEVFDNLIDNAIKYGAAGSEVTLKVKCLKKPKRLDGPAVRISVHNKGKPIPRDQIPRLTERFYRVDKSRSRELGGTGLGLAIVKHIILHHRGKLEIESAPKTGTTFSVYLPV